MKDATATRVIGRRAGEEEKGVGKEKDEGCGGNWTEWS